VLKDIAPTSAAAKSGVLEKGDLVTPWIGYPSSMTVRDPSNLGARESRLLPPDQIYGDVAAFDKARK